jgi:hypothetical protein
MAKRKRNPGSRGNPGIGAEAVANVYKYDQAAKHLEPGGDINKPEVEAGESVFGSGEEESGSGEKESE